MWAKQAHGASAWVNFDGTNCPSNWCAVRSSYNVSGVWRNATGTYTISYAIAMPDTAYMFQAQCGDGGYAPYAAIAYRSNTTTNSTQFVVVGSSSGAGVSVNWANCNAFVFR